jgi:hypothetical protein
MAARALAPKVQLMRTVRAALIQHGRTHRPRRPDVFRPPWEFCRAAAADAPATLALCSVAIKRAQAVAAPGRNVHKIRCAPCPTDTPRDAAGFCRKWARPDRGVVEGLGGCRAAFFGLPCEDRPINLHRQFVVYWTLGKLRCRNRTPSANGNGAGPARALPATAVLVRIIALLRAGPRSPALRNQFAG